MASLSLARIGPRGVLYLATLVVAASPFIYALYLILGFPYNPAYKGTNLILRVMILSAFFEYEYFHFILDFGSIFLLYLVPYFIFIIVFLLVGFGVIRITRRRTVAVQKISIFIWLTIYLVIFFVPFFPEIVWP
ncbi:MAG: hypothetical protein HY080_02855 [Gammaproteobacteria bacterium]|nr:hypothetical protein [Gammaproteobacteria bacterium]